MDILYVSNVCSEKEYALLFENSKKFVSQQSQKFNRLMAEGFAHNNCNVDVVSGRPVSKLQKQKIFKFKSENVNKVNYNYLGFLNFKFVRNYILMLKAKKFAKKWCREHPNGIMICDALNLTMATSVSKIFKKHNMKIFACVTDLPEDLMNNKSKISSYLFTNNFRKVTKRCSGYIVLSKYMMESENLNDLPYVVVEGMVDSNIKNEHTKKHSKKKNIVMYAGLLYKKYGVSTLLNGFIKSGIKDYELHFYGVGNNFDSEDDSLKDIIEASKTHKNIKYCGSVSNKECVDKEIESMLLVNPRPTNERFVRNSFPSKNMEYMASGTPILTTNLPSMPDEYHKYCFIVKDETDVGFSTSLKKILKQDSKVLSEKGKLAKEFVLKEKNNISQTKKIIDFISKI